MTLREQFALRLVGHDEVPPSTLLANPRNARSHPQDQMDLVRSLLEDVGWVAPILVNRRTGFVLDGHARIELAMQSGQEIVPVSYVDLDESQETRMITLLDYSASLATVNKDQLAHNLEDIGVVPKGPIASALADLATLHIGKDEPALPEPGEGGDEFDQEAKETRCRVGDVWGLGWCAVCPFCSAMAAYSVGAIGRHTCGQCGSDFSAQGTSMHRVGCVDSSHPDLLDLVGTDVPTMIYADPPYGMNLDTDYTSMVSNFHEGGGGNAYEKVIGDSEPFDPACIMREFASCHEQFWWGADYYADRIPSRLEGSWIVWDKRLTETADLMYGSCFEMCWSKTKHKRDFARIKWAGIFGTEQETEHKRLHPTQKPVALATWFFTRYGGKKDVILDPFLGSAPSLIAAHRLGKRLIGAEIDPGILDIVLTRWTTETGEDPVLLSRVGPPKG